MDLLLFICGLFTLVFLGAGWLKSIQADQSKAKHFKTIKGRYYV